MIPDIRRVQSALESAGETAARDAVEQVAGLGYPQAAELLTNVTDVLAQTATERYKQLGDYLLVKYLDGNIKKEKDGAFERTPEGMPVQPVFGGYNERYFRSIVRDAGDRLKVVQPAAD